MRNRYPGVCYRCNTRVEAGEGFFERSENRGWKVQHAGCAIKFRGTDVGVDLVAKERKRTYLAERQIRIWKEKARGIGKSANKARKALKMRGIEWEETPCKA